MAHYVKVVSISFPGVSEGERRKERALTSALEWIDRAAQEKPDIVCLPETFTGLGCSNEAWFATAEPVPGPTSEAVSEKARQYGTYIICPMVHQKEDRTYNSAVLIDRRGEVVGAYHKIHPTIGEIESGITPGTEPTVFETDFGRIGCAICFDINFQDVGDGLFANGAEIVFFPSMFRAGLILSIWAVRYRCFVISATPGEQSVIVNPLGRVLVQSFVHGRVIARTLNLDKEVLHLDYNAEKLDDLKTKYGPDVELEIASPEAVFLLSSHHPRATARDMIREFELEPVADYFDRANRIRTEALAQAGKNI